MSGLHDRHRHFTVQQLAELGVAIESYRGPRFRMSGGWLLGPLVLVGGTALVWTRAESRGRDQTLWLPLLIYLCLASTIAVVVVRQVRRLNDVGRPDLELLGWSVGGVKKIRALAGHGSAGWRSPIGSPVVGCFLSSRGTLFVLVDQRSVGLVEADGRRFTAAIGHRDDRYWLLLADGNQRVALRLLRPRVT